MRCHWLLAGCVALIFGQGCGDDSGTGGDGETSREEEDAGSAESSESEDSATDATSAEATEETSSSEEVPEPETTTDEVVNGVELLLNGVVSTQPPGSTVSAASPTSDADVSIEIDGVSVASTTTNSEGRFELNTEVEENQQIVVRFSAEGTAPQFRTVVAGPAAEISLSILLRPVEELTCAEGVCSLGGGKLKLEGLDADVSGSARVFNPKTETDAFPGDFSDDAGNLLVSGVFASIELTDGSGAAMGELPTPARLRMELPRDSWPVVVDVDDQNEVIDVPLYSFDESSGEWVSDGQGWLEDAAAEPLDIADLEALHDGSYEGLVYAAGDIMHLSYWNVDWPITSHGCVMGVIVDDNGDPVAGATASISGVSYTGTSRPQTTDASGSFCSDVMRSEGADEDVDQDGVQGETHSVSVRLQRGGSLYAGGAHDLPVEAATCGGDCLDLGEIPLDSASELHPVICALSGVVEQVDGTPAAGALILGSDSSLDQATLSAVCGETLTECDLVATADADGAFTLRTALLDTSSITAYWTDPEAAANNITRIRFTTATVLGCPEEPMRLRLDQGQDQYTLEITVEGDEISWTPELALTSLLISRGGMPLWQIAADTEMGFTGPVTYGTAPEGATAFFPLDGSAPDALTSGDQILLSSAVVQADGILAYGQGTLLVP
jgi:hypothetical protein